MAVKNEVSYETLYNIIDGESRWNVDVPDGAAGEIGIAQILPTAHPNLTREQMSDPLFSLQFVIDEIKKGNQWKWVGCSCVQFARALGVKIPPKTDAKDLKPNATPQIGGLVLLKYGKLDHVATITSLGSQDFSVREANYQSPCQITKRTITYQDKAIRGFWSPLSHPTISTLANGG